MFSARFTGYSAAYPSDGAWFWAPSDWRLDQNKYRYIIANHGAGGSEAWGSDTSLFNSNYHIWQLLKTNRYVVIALNNLGPQTFGSPAVMRSLDDAYNWCVNFGMASSKIGLLGGSMGGVTSLNWLRRNKEKVAATWLWSPLCDMEWANDTAGYTAPYSVGSVGYPTGYVSPITSAYAANTTTTAAVTIPVYGNPGVTIPVVDAKAFSDANGPVLPLIGGVATYTGKDDTHLYGVTMVQGQPAFNVANGGSISSSSDWQLQDYDPMRSVADYRGMASKVQICTALDDATIPYGQSQYFVDQIADPNVAMHQIASGGHTNLFPGIPFDEFVSFYDSAAW